MLKRQTIEAEADGFDQPPSGGCVLKLALDGHHRRKKVPAAFGRLCVET